MGLNNIEEYCKRAQDFHVLAVDDNITDRKLLERLILIKFSSCQAYAVTCVESGDKALKYLGLHDHPNDTVSYTAAASTSSSSPPLYQGMKVNLIMTDFCMPGMSGYDLLKRLKKSSWKDVPVVVMSSENIPSRINMCLEGGAEEFLLKPLQLSDLNNIQTHLLKSLHHSPTTLITHQFINISEDYNGKNYLKNSSHGASSKRKAASPQPPERRSKMKELAGL